MHKNSERFLSCSPPSLPFHPLLPAGREPKLCVSLFLSTHTASSGGSGAGISKQLQTNKREHCPEIDHQTTNRIPRDPHRGYLAMFSESSLPSLGIPASANANPCTLLSHSPTPPFPHSHTTLLKLPSHHSYLTSLGDSAASLASFGGTRSTAVQQ